MSRPLLRLNGARYELLPAPGRTGLRGDRFEIRRKADDRPIAHASLSHRARVPKLTVADLRGHAGRIDAALDDLGVLLLAHFGRRGRLAIARAPHAQAQPRRDPALPHVAVPADYVARTGLPAQPEPRVLGFAGTDMFGRRQWLTREAARAWRLMRDAADADGVELLLVSAYRSVVYQTVLVQRKLARGLTMDEILKVNAAPGYSEHHSGRALDVNTRDCAPAEEAFENTAAFAWLMRRAGEFGYALSYPRGNPHGILYEPWHWCFHGAASSARM